MSQIARVSLVVTANPFQTTPKASPTRKATIAVAPMTIEAVNGKPSDPMLCGSGRGQHHADHSDRVIGGRQGSRMRSRNDRIHSAHMQKILRPQADN